MRTFYRSELKQRCFSRGGVALGIQGCTQFQPFHYCPFFGSFMKSLSEFAIRKFSNFAASAFLELMNVCKNFQYDYFCDSNGVR